MKKILSILVVAVWLMQAVTINVHAAPLLQGSYGVDIVKNTNGTIDETTGQFVYVNINTSDHSSDYVVSGIEGDGSDVATASASITTMCPNEGDPNTTSDCPAVALTVVVKNHDTINAQKLYACAYITQDDDTWVTFGNFRAHNPISSNTSSQLAPPLPLPYAKCQTYNVLANSAKAVVVDIDGLVGNEGEMRVWHVRMAFSWAEIDTCNQPFTTMSTDTFAINVQVTDPVSQSAPDQIYDVTPGQYYKIYTSGTYYSVDYTNEYFSDEVHISWDGTTWKNIELYDSGECFESEGDRTGWYVLAESDKFYIRVGDGLLGDTSFYNHPSPFGSGYASTDHVADGTTFSYTIELGVPPGACNNQFTHSSGDLVDSITVPANQELGIVASDMLTPGEWYTLVVTSGTWQDEGTGPERVDMEYKVTGSADYNEDAAFQDFSGGGSGSWCASDLSGTVYLQAQNTTLRLRVNNETGGFSSNTGSLDVSIYATTFTRNIEACEVDFNVDGLQDHQTVSANAENGKVWGTWSGPGTSSGLGTASGGNLVPGAWYVIDTSDGPWMQNGSGLLGTAHPVSAFYDMAVSEDGDTWIPLEDWTVPDCNVNIDALGHRRIYFQAPSDAGFSWYFHVADTDGNWNSNAGELGWNLYRATNTGASPGTGVTLTDPWAVCGDTYAHRLIYNAGTSIPVQEEEGTYLRQSLLGIAGTSEDEVPADASGSMSVGDVYKLTVTGGPWLDDTDEHYDAAISSDDGATWYALDDDSNPDLDCISVDQAHRYYTVMFTVASGQRWKVRVNDETGDFVGNGGNLSYKMYKLTDNDADVLGTAGSGSPNASGLGVASGGLAVCIQALMYPSFPSVAGVFTQPDPPTGSLDVWEWVQWVGESIQQSSTALITYFPNFISAGFNYAVSWINYAVLAAQKFFAFCPKDQGTLMNAINLLKTKEPLATVLEVINFVRDVKEQLLAYDWGDYADTSIFSLHSSSQVQALINNYILRKDAAVQNPWSGSNNVVSFGSSGLPESYYACGTAFTDYLPSRLRSAVCFVTAYFKETGATFWIQLLVVDIGAISIYAMSTKRALQELIYMMTGVKPWTKSGLNSSVDKLADYMEKRDRQDEIERELDKRFGSNRTARDWRYK